MCDLLDKEIAAYQKLEAKLLKHHHGKYVVIFDGEFIDAFDSFDNAAQEAIRRFGKGPFLIRKVGKKEEMPLPASVAFRPDYASH